MVFIQEWHEFGSVIEPHTVSERNELWSDAWRSPNETWGRSIWGFVVMEVYDISLSSSSDSDGDLVSSSSGSVKIIMELSASLFNKEVLSFNFVYLDD